MRGVRPHTERRPPKTRTEIKEMRFPRVWTQRRDQIPTLGPRAQSNRLKFNESAMHKSAERPIEIQRVVFSEVPTLHDDLAHNTRSVSRVTDISSTESSDSAQLNGSASNHPTSTPGATSPTIPRRSERLSQPLERYSPGIFFIDAGEPTSYEEASAAADSATWHPAMESEMHSIRTNKTWDLVNLPRKPTCSSLQVGL